MTQARGTNTVQATRTSLAVLETLKRLDGAGVTAVAEELGIPKSTTHNHLRTLVDEGYVVAEEDGYRPSLRFLEFGEATRHRLSVYGTGEPEVRRLAEETGELANMAVEERGWGVYVARASGSDAVQVDVFAGMHVHLHCTALGKALLAHLSDARVDEILDRHGLPELTDETITDRETLHEELATVRERGYAYDRGERLPGIRCVAAPVVDPDGRVLAALSVSGPSTRMQGDRFHEEIPELLVSAANVVEINVTYA
jgi:DNA-binding IclR family transcriptional regulator